MYSRTRLLFKYLRHRMSASNSRGHGTHSPFVYDFIRQVLKDRQDPEWFSRIEGMRKNLLRNTAKISVTDLGGKGNGSERIEPVARIARRSLSSASFGRLLFRMAKHYKAGKILELGTSLGISGSYLLAGAGPDATLVSIEGSEQVAACAENTFRQLGLKHVRVLTGDFSDRLPELPGMSFHPDLVFIDGNHRKTPLLNYFNAVLQQAPRPRIIILHDIHWSPEMESAWQTICRMPDVMLTLDLFFAGIVFFDDKFMIKQHFRIRF